MVKQYPHRLIASIITEAHRDADGNWVPGTTETIETDCRAEPNVRASYLISSVDGSKIQFDWTVYMRYGAQLIPDGAAIVVKHGEIVRATGKVIRFTPGQLNTRLWI